MRDSPRARNKGTGSIEARGAGSWRITVEVGPPSEDGKRTRHRETVKGNKRDAERRLREILSAAETGVYVAPSRKTTGQFLEEWAATYAVLNTSPRTAQSYAAEFRRHVIPALGKIPLSDLRTHHIQAYYVEALKSGRKDGMGGLSPRTVAYHHRILSEALEHAVRQNLLVRNPAKVADPPRPARVDIAMLAAEDTRRFLQAAAESEYFALLLAALYTGARLGELLALQWRNVDLDSGMMSIMYTLYRTGSEWHLKEPKSARSRRQIAMPRALTAHLEEHKKTLEAERVAMGGQLTAEDFVFGQWNGKPRDERSVNRGFARVLRNAGLPHIRFHDLRHTHASLMLKAGVHPKVVSERLGHGSVSFTLDVYSHVMPGLQESAAAKLEALIGGAP